MKKIFILKGKGNTAKTTKINKIAQWIIDTYHCPNTIGLNTTDFEIDTLGVLNIGKLSIGINSSGDNLYEVQKIKELKGDEDNFPDIIICACRTKGAGFRYIRDNFNYSTGWLSVFINVEEFISTDIKSQTIRDSRIDDELKTWLVGLPKI